VVGAWVDERSQGAQDLHCPVHLHDTAPQLALAHGRSARWLAWLQEACVSSM